MKVKEGYEIGKVNSAIQGHTRKASAIRTKSMLTNVSGSLSGFSRVVSVLVGAIWVLGLIILIVAFAMIANERKKEFALLRLLGCSRRVLSGLIWKESALVSLAGALTGILCAAVLVFPFTTLIETNLGLPYLTPSVLRIIITGLISLIATAAAGSFAGALTAGRLSRVDPGKTLRENG